ncbi:MAG: peptidyl-prolyl cis-trans isomerase [Burkholderiales bacterium]|nr:MAG: peptidyl-prolyl cis-trans isomerase [Burkholderiales bacterium]TAG79301.1 MAG: peptidyl-prolyl cis-trans isomerase [Betaproteobacteria bacterium]
MIAGLFGMLATGIVSAQDKAAPKAAEKAPMKAVASATKPQVEMRTSAGTIVIELDPAAAPKSVENFLEYVKSGFYEGTVFHRVIKGFMIQGGGFDKAMTQKPTRDAIQNEAEAALKAGLKNDRGTIAMARTNAPHSATAQFFINHVNNDRLTHPSFDGWGYAVFGKVVSGMDVVDKIAEMPVANNGPHQNVPTTAVVIEKVTLKK